MNGRIRSIRFRFAVTAVATLLRSGISFLTGLVIAKTLGPDEYGNYMFLTGSFVALQLLLDLGTSSAFYTFLCQRTRSTKFILAYLAWQSAGLVVSLIAIRFILPQSIIKSLWLNHDNGLILLALVAVFFQQQIWISVNRIGESSRLSQTVQMVSLFVAIVQLGFISLASFNHCLSIRLIFSLIALEFFLAVLVSLALTLKPKERPVEPTDWKLWFREYRIYCTPLIVYGGVGFIYAFSDNWLLQRFGGAKQQGFYSIANQLSALSLLATTALLNIFWKEFTEAHEKNDTERLSQIFSKTSKFLFFVATTISVFCVSWASEIILILLGKAFSAGTIPFTIMLFYPIYQCLGQITGIAFYATSKTKAYVSLGMVMMGISIPLSYLLQAAPTERIPGWGLGATGLALKMVFLNVIGVNLQIWLLAKNIPVRFGWKYQVLVLGGGLAVSDLCRRIGSLTYSIWPRLLGSAGENPYLFLPPILISGFLYGLIIMSTLFYFPQLAGLNRDDLGAVKRAFKAINRFG